MDSKAKSIPARSPRRAPAGDRKATTPPRHRRRRRATPPTSAELLLADAFAGLVLRIHRAAQETQTVTAQMKAHCPTCKTWCEVRGETDGSTRITMHRAGKLFCPGSNSRVHPPPKPTRAP